MSKFCTKCGAALEAGNAFCLSCGTPVAAEAAQPAQSFSPSQQYNVNLKPTRKPLPHNLIPIICLAVGLILLIIGLVYPIPSDNLFKIPASEAIVIGSQISGATTAKAVYIVGGLLIACVSALKFKKSDKK